MADENKNVIRYTAGPTETAVSAVAKIEVGQKAYIPFEKCEIRKTGEFTFVRFPTDEGLSAGYVSKTANNVMTGTIEFDGDGRLETDRMLDGIRGGERKWAILANGKALFSIASIGELATGFVEAVTKLWSKGVAYFGQTDTDLGGVANFSGYGSTVNAVSVSTANGSPLEASNYVEDGLHNGVMSYKNGQNYVMYQGAVTGIGNKWFIDTQKRTEDEGFASAQFIHTLTNVANPWDSPFNGQNAQAGNTASAVFIPAGGRKGWVANTGKITESLELPSGTAASISDITNAPLPASLFAQLSSTSVSGFALTSDANNITISQGTATLKSADNETAPFVSTTFTPAVIAKSSLTVNVLYIVFVVEGAIQVTSDINQAGAHNKTAIHLIMKFADGSISHQDIRNYAIDNAHNSLLQKLYTGIITKATGTGTAGVTPTTGATLKNLSIGSALLFWDKIPVNIPSFNTAGADRFTSVWRGASGVGFVETPNIALIDHTKWDNNGTQSTVNLSKYGNHIVFRETTPTGKVWVQRDVAEYATESEAVNALLPSVRPAYLGEFTTIEPWFKVTIRGDGTVVEIRDLIVSALGNNPSTNAGTPTDHQALDNLQGGSATERYHLTLTEKTDLTDGGDSTAHYHASDRNRANHTGTQSVTTVTGTKAQFNASVTDGDILYVGDVVSNATHTGDVTGSTTLTIANNAVTNAKMADVPTATIKGRVSASAGDPEDLTVAQVQGLLNIGLVKGTENSKTGFWLHGDDRAYKLDIGENAVDLSFATSGSYGPTGDYSYAEGYVNRASGFASHAEGTGTNADGQYCHVEGNACRSFVSSSHAEGVHSYIDGAPDGAHCEGAFPNIMGAGKMSVTGIGTSTSARKDGRILWTDGTESYPESTPALITARGNKASATVEYVTEKTASTALLTGMVTTNPVQAVGTDTIVVAVGKHEARLTGETWVYVSTLSNGWVTFDNGNNRVKYKKINNTVYFYGVIKNGVTTAGTVVFTFPVGYRPTGTIVVACPAGAEFNIQPTGAVEGYQLNASATYLYFSFIID